MKTNRISIFFVTLLTVFIFSSCGNDKTNNQSDNNNKNTVNNVSVEKTEKLYTESELENLDASELRILRNEIFAKHGYIFKSKDLKEHFNKFDWYKPEHENVDKMLSDIDVKNIELIKSFEAKLKGGGSNFEDFLALFEEVESDYFQIKWDEMENFEVKGVSDEFARDFLGVDIDEFGKECGFIKFSAHIRFKIPNSENIGVVLSSMICPVPAVYEEVNLVIFDKNGNKLESVDLSYLRGGGGESDEAYSIFEDEGFTKTVTIIEGLPEPSTTTEQYRITFAENTSKVSEKKL